MGKTFKYSVGPWNLHQGADMFGPPVRPDVEFGRKLELFKEIGFDALQLHDDDAVPDLNNFSGRELAEQARKLKHLMDETGLVVEFIAPRLWEDPETRDGAYTANREKQRNYAMERTKKALEIADILGTRNIVLWLAREGNFVPESKDAVKGVERIVEAVNSILDHNKSVRVLFEPKPNEPVDKSFVPTVGHALALACLTKDPDRVGVLIESAHSILAGLDPSDDMAFALAHKKLWGVHLNDQNGLKFDQDRPFGSVNLRSAFNQVRVLIENGFGRNGEYVGVDVKALRTQDAAAAHKHLRHSLEAVEWMAQKAKSLNMEFVEARRQDLDFEALDRYMIKHLLGI
ncbi:TIM barrel protein [Paenibacillus koleovorans]|uniref:TIM barrel protein n=1 Tax=Paenibacillus koleovorans TaxID=121608 RepID=UPI000FD8FA2B|nr:TIM barrel protein [Paenibacillus koleovorans]